MTLFKKPQFLLLMNYLRPDLTHWLTHVNKAAAKLARSDVTRQLEKFRTEFHQQINFQPFPTNPNHSGICTDNYNLFAFVLVACVLLKPDRKYCTPWIPHPKCGVCTRARIGCN